MTGEGVHGGLSSCDGSFSVHITFDCQHGFPLTGGDRVVVTRSARTLRLVKAPERDYYNVLRTKLKWGEPTARR